MTHTAATSGERSRSDQGIDDLLRPLALDLAVTLSGGVLWGVLGLTAQRWLPYPWANLANSGAMWAVGAFAGGMWIGPRLIRASVAGAVLLVVALEAYYVSAVVIHLDDVSTLWTPSSRMWLVAGVLVGALFGVCGAATRSRRRSWQIAGAGVLALVFIVEALHLLARPAATRTPWDLQTALIELGLAVVLSTSALLIAPSPPPHGPRDGDC